MFLFAAVAFAAVTLSANPLKGWIPTRSDLRPKNPDMIKTTKDTITLSGIPSTSWLLFDVNKVDAKKGQTVEITVTASGKGNVDIGFYEYKNGFNVAGLNVKKLALTDKAQEQKIVIPIKYADTTLFRPVFRLASDSQVVVSKYALTVVKPAK